MRASLTHRFRVLATVVGLMAGLTLHNAPTALSANDATLADGSGQRRALLIGINKYRVLPRLNGSLNDVEVIRHILLQRWGFKESNITVVLDEAATRTGILQALERLVQDTGPADTVYVHYSGHGSQVQDTNGDEADGIDETIVPQDGRTADVPDITDDELDAIFARLRARQALIVLDSCHSGTATRSVEIQARSVPQDTRLSLYRTGVATRQVVPLVTQRHILMTGAAAHEQALDGPVEGRFHGFFSYALSKSLRSANPNVTPREVFSGVEQELKRIQAHFGRASMPEPQLEAPPALLEAPLFGSRAAAASAETQTPHTAWVETQPADAGHVLLVNGPLFGAMPGSVWALYPPDETTFSQAHALGTATVTKITGKDAVAQLAGSVQPIRKGSRAVNVLTAGSARVPIRLLDTTAEKRALVERELQRLIGNVDLVGHEAFARFMIESKDNTLRVYGADGTSMVASFSLQDQHWPAGLARIISRSANASELMTLENPGSRIHLQAKVALPPRARLSRSIAVVADTQPAAYRIRKAGEPRLLENSLQLEVLSDTEGYLTIVDVDSEGQVNILFPNDHQKADFYPEGRISAGQPVLIPDSLESRNRAGFFWDYIPPAGEDTIRAFLSTDLQTAQMIRTQVKTEGRGLVKARGADVPPGSGLTPLADLRKGLTELSSRGFILVNEPSTSAFAPMPPPRQSPVAAPAPMPPSPPSIPVPAPPSPMTGAAPTQGPSTSAVGDWTATTVSIVVGP